MASRRTKLKIVISGASRGIGAGLAKEFAKRGHHVICLARSHGDLEKLCSQIETEGGKASFSAVDLSQVTETLNIVKKILADHGTPDILINNAGAGRFRSVEEAPPQEAIEMMTLPYFAAYTLTHGFLPSMLKLSQEKKPVQIVNVTSPASVIPFAGATGYSAARFAMRGFTEALRADLKGTNVLVSLAMPGKVESHYWQANPGSAERVPKISKLIPTLSEEAVGLALYRGIMSRKRWIVVPLMLKLFLILYWFMPGPIEWLLHSSGWKRT